MVTVSSKSALSKVCADSSFVHVCTVFVYRCFIFAKPGMCHNWDVSTV